MKTPSNRPRPGALLTPALITLASAMSCTVATVPCAVGDANCNPAAALLYAVDAETAAATETIVEPTDQFVGGQLHTCALLIDDGSVRCWGSGLNGRLGYANTNDIGDDETPASAGNVNVGDTATAITAGQEHTCALIDGGKVRCWGNGASGRLGYSNTNDIGDDETPTTAGDVNVGGTVTAISAGTSHTCALLDTGNVRCWGQGSVGRLGYANTNDIGDDENPVSAGDVNVGGTVSVIAAGSTHTCALLTTGNVRCWGQSSSGQLGYANTNIIGDDETPASAGDVNIGGTAIAIGVAGNHTCALLDIGNVRCWGQGTSGKLGYANTTTIGDNETPASAGDLNLGGTATAISTGSFHNCALLDTGSVRCWGQGGFGGMGYGNTNNIGDDETPASAGDVDFGGSATLLAQGDAHTCVLLDDESLKCWGLNSNGQLGNLNTNNIGDDELPGSIGVVSYK